MPSAEELEKLQKEEMATIAKSCEFLEKCAKNLGLVTQNLQKQAEEIISNHSSGSLNDPEISKKMWHGLNNIEHQLKQFLTYAETSTRDVQTASIKLMEELRTLRKD